MVEYPYSNFRRREMSELTQFQLHPQSKIDVLYFRKIETCPLTPETISKKHLRLLETLYCFQQQIPNARAYVDVFLLKAWILAGYRKSYSLGDLAFHADDLHRRNYLYAILSGDGVVSYAITEEGELLLSATPDPSEYRKQLQLHRKERHQVMRLTRSTCGNELSI